MKKALETLIDCYNKNDFYGISDYLCDDCAYSSQWVFDEKSGSEWIENYLIQKSLAIKNSGSKVIAKKGIIHSQNNSKECAILFQQNDLNPSCIILTEYDGEKIRQIDICMPELFQYECID